MFTILVCETASQFSAPARLAGSVLSGAPRTAAEPASGNREKNFPHRRGTARYRGLSRFAWFPCPPKAGGKNRNRPQAKSKKGAHLSADPSPAWRDRDFVPLCWTPGRCGGLTPAKRLKFRSHRTRRDHHRAPPGDRVADLATHLGTVWTLSTDLFSTQWPVASRTQHSAFLGMVQLACILILLRRW